MSMDRDQEKSAFTRRTTLSAVAAAILATAAVLPVVSAPPALSAEAIDEQFLAWELEAIRLCAQANEGEKDEDEVAELVGREMVFERLIFQTPSTSRTAAQVKVRRLLRNAQDTMMVETIAPLDHILAALNVA